MNGRPSTQFSIDLVLFVFTSRSRILCTVEHAVMEATIISLTRIFSPSLRSITIESWLREVFVGREAGNLRDAKI